MKTKTKFLALLILIVLTATLFAPNNALAASTITVKVSDVGVSWFTASPVADTRTGGSVSFVMGPGTAPSGIGSLQMTTTDANGGSQAKAQAITGLLVGTPLNQITALSYYAYRDSSSTNNLAQTISLNIAVDFLGDGVSFTTLVFEPVYQPGGVGAMQLNTWQLWDAFAGGDAVWWSTKPITGVCDFNCFVSWDTILAHNPDAKVKGIFGFNVGSGWAGQFKGAADALTVGILGNDTIYDFEPEPLCTTVCYVDAVNGNDANGGASLGNAKKTIQAAIDAVSANGTVRVLPGSYNETATNRFVLGTNGPHQFGLFIDKDGVTVQGVDANDIPITDYNTLGAYVTTNATNNFGASGFFVQGDDVTIAALHIGPNIPGDNKTIEIIGNGFTLKDSHVDVPGGGSVYFNDWQFDTGADTSHIQTYTLDHNLIDQSTSVDIASGAGYSGPAAGRQIVNNEFENAEYWPSISFNGSGTGVPWFVQSVGGAVIQGNTFTNTFNGTNVTAAHVRVRGAVDNSQFDWTAYWTGNTFNKAVVTLAGAYPPFDVRQYNYMSGSYSFDVRRIGVNIQSGIDKAQPGDTVLVKDGTYPESPNINKSLTLKSWAGRDATTIQLQSGPTYLGALTIGGTNVTVDGFTIAGVDGTATTLASSNIYVTSTPEDVTITNNRIKVGAIADSSNGDDGFGLLTTYSPNSDVEQVTVTGNSFEPLTAAGGRVFYINPGVNHFRFADNEITGKFTRTAITQAKNGVVEVNTLTGTGAAGSRSAGFGTWGYPDPTVYGHTIFRNNTINNAGKGIAVFATNNVTVENNFFADNDLAVWTGDNGSLAFDPSTVLINKNSIVNSGLYGVQNASLFTGSVNAEINWWGSNLPADVAAEVTGNVDYTPWLCSGVDTSPDPGFQPSLQTGCYTFTGFFQPIDMNAANIAKAGQTIAVKWRLTDANGLPISDPSAFLALRTQAGSCDPGLPPDAIETYSGSSGLQYLGDGYWQFNWKTPKSYAGTCRTMFIEFQGGLQSPLVTFKFK